MTHDTRPTSPATALVAIAVEGCIGVLYERLGPIDDIQRHVLTLALTKVVADHIEREVLQLLAPGSVH